MNRVDVKEYFDLLEKTINENHLVGKSCHIFTWTRVVLQLNNKPGEVIA